VTVHPKEQLLKFCEYQQLVEWFVKDGLTKVEECMSDSQGYVPHWKRCWIINKLFNILMHLLQFSPTINCVMGENPPTVYRALTGIIFAQRYVPGGKQQNTFQEGPSCYQRVFLEGGAD